MYGTSTYSIARLKHSTKYEYKQLCVLAYKSKVNCFIRLQYTVAYSIYEFKFFMLHALQSIWSSEQVELELVPPPTISS